MGNNFSKLPNGLPFVDLVPTRNRVALRKIQNKPLPRGKALVRPPSPSAKASASDLPPTKAIPYLLPRDDATSEDSDFSSKDSDGNPVLYKILAVAEIPL